MKRRKKSRERIPTEFSVGGRTYEILSLFKPDEERIRRGEDIIIRAKEMNAHLGRDEYYHLFLHQDEIPAVLRGKVTFIFTDFTRGKPTCVYCIYWWHNSWIRYFEYLSSIGNDSPWRVLRRKS